MGDLYAIITAICWSSAVILFDISSKKFAAIEINAIKNFIGVLGFFSTIILFSIPIPELTNNDLLTLALSGVLGILIADLLFLESLRRLGSGLSAVVSTIYTPSIFIIAFILFNESVKMQSYLGGMLVIGGIILSVYKMPKTITTRDMYLGVAFGILAHILTAYSVLIVRPIMANSSVVFIALYRFGIGLFTTVAICVIRSSFISVLMIFKEGLSNRYVLLGSFLGTYLSVIFWLAGYKYTLAGRAAIYNQLSTIFIVLMARAFLNEPFTIRKSIGVSLAIIGAIVVSVAN